MKLLIQSLIFVMFSISPVIAQFQARSQSAPDFDAEKVAGIHYYDIEKTIKKLKVEEKKIDTVTQLLNEFNLHMDQILLTNEVVLKELDEDFDKNVQVAVSQRNPALMDGVKERIRKIIPPVAEEVQTKEEDLTSRLREVLDSSQLDKWLKYQRRNRPRNNFNDRF